MTGYPRKSKMKQAIIIGSASCVFDDFDAAVAAIGVNFDLCAVKYAGVFWPGEIDYWISLHPEKLQPFVEERGRRGHPPARRIIVHRQQMDREVGRWKYPINAEVYPEFRWVENGSSGSSSLYAVKCLLKDGYERIVLCGCPMDKTVMHLEPNATPRFAKSTEHFKRGWQQALPEIRDKVYSMSGWTRDLLGEPSW